MLAWASRCRDAAILKLARLSLRREPIQLCKPQPDIDTTAGSLLELTADDDEEEEPDGGG